MTDSSTVFITGVAGFIGFHLARHYHLAGCRVVGVDEPGRFAANDIRRIRMAVLRRSGVEIKEGDLSQQHVAEELFACGSPRVVFNMAARTNARCCDAHGMGSDNIAALVNMLAAAQKTPPAHFLFASSSSVYGEHSPRPFSEKHIPAMPDNLYGASKLIGERASLFWSGVFPVTGIRFFNVYGPWGRPDMAPFYFADCLAHNREIKIFTQSAQRAWLYIDDAIEACVRLADLPPQRGAARFINVAGPELVRTSEVLNMIVRRMNKVPRVVECPPACPEVTSNPADLELLESLVGGAPQTVFARGVEKFLEWHQNEWLSFNWRTSNEK